MKKQPHSVTVSLALFVFAGTLCAQGSGLKKAKLGPQINSAEREHHPRVSADGEVLYFTRENFVDDDLRAEVHDQLTQGLQGKAKEEMIRSLAPSLTYEIYRSHGHQNIWLARRRPDGSWGEAQKMAPPLNGRFSSFLCTSLPDGNTLLVGSAQFDNPSPQVLLERLFPPGLKEAAITANWIVALTVRAGEGWSLPIYLKIDGFKTTSLRNDFELAPGNRILILSLINEESVGKRDLYVSFRQPDGSWSRPQNLKAPVNGPGDDFSPFMAADGVSLYFASERPGGFGASDIYLSRRLDDTWLRWSPPQNLGAEVNSEQEESDLTVDASGRYAFLSAGLLLHEDLYVFELPDRVKPAPLAFIHGRAHDPQDKPVAAAVTYERLRDGVGAGEANCDRLTGHYRAGLAIGDVYGFRAEAAGYIPVSDRIDLGKAKPSEEFQRDLLLVPIKPGATIRLNNLFFEFAKTTLLPESGVELKKLVQILQQYPKMEIEIAGHTDDIGDDRSNQVLSEGRATAVLKYLQEHGIAAARLRSRGYGEGSPVAPNDTDEHRQLNRRVEFTILKTE